MSKNTLLSELINYISANSSGNVVIAAPSSGYALDVTGTGRFTGALTGTTATFSGDLTLNNGSADGGQLVLASSGYSSWNLDNFSGRFRAYYGSTEYLTITSAGNVGIGTSSPTKPLYISSTVSDKVYLTGGTTQNGILLDAVGTSHQYYYGAGNNLLVGGDQGALMAYDVTTGRAAVFFDTSNNIRFGTTASGEWMRITSGGGVYINRASNLGAGYGLVLGSDNSQLQTMAMFVANNGNNNINFFNASGTYVASISTSASTVTYGTGSDYRLKEDYRDFNGLEKVSAIKVYDFKFKSEGDRMEGVIAHELQEVIPYAVNGEKDAINEDGSPKIQNVDYSKLVPILIKSIQELKSEIDLLKQQ